MARGRRSDRRRLSHLATARSFESNANFGTRPARPVKLDFRCKAGSSKKLNDRLDELLPLQGYALDAEAVGDERLAGFFREVQAAHERIAERAEDMLSDGDDRLPLVGVPSSKAPAEGDPGDVAAGQEDA